MPNTNQATKGTSNKVVIDILESEILRKYSKVLSILLCDRTTKKNIFWATDDYEDLGEEFGYFSTIKTKSVTGANGKVIMPRVAKNKVLQGARVKERAEVFTPAWVCNSQNNQIDSAWFQKDGVFNTEYKHLNGTRCWKTNPSPINFPKNRTWKDYVARNCLEIACGEGPYITSRYDSVTGDFIPVGDRIGILDRKLRVVSENTNTSAQWLRASAVAFKSTYAYEWQGDNLLLAREAMLYTFIENYTSKFNKEPPLKSIQNIALIISWNVWQMDGTKGVVPNSCFDDQLQLETLFNEKAKNVSPCPGCLVADIYQHNGKYCLVKDWFIKNEVDGEEGSQMMFINVFRQGTSQ